MKRKTEGVHLNRILEGSRADSARMAELEHAMDERIDRLIRMRENDFRALVEGVLRSFSVRSAEGLADRLVQLFLTVHTNSYSRGVLDIAHLESEMGEDALDEPAQVG